MTAVSVALAYHARVWLPVLLVALIGGGLYACLYAQSHPPSPLQQIQKGRRRR